MEMIFTLITQANCAYLVGGVVLQHREQVTGSVHNQKQRTRAVIHKAVLQRFARLLTNNQVSCSAYLEQTDRGSLAGDVFSQH